MTPENRGFSLSEMLVVIAVLGMLAAFAVPRFVYKVSDSNAAAVQKLAGSVRTSAFLARELSDAQGSPERVEIQGKSIALEGGYPTAAAINDAVVHLAGFNFEPGLWTREGARTPVQCSVRYAPAAHSGAVPRVDLDTRGC